MINIYIPLGITLLFGIVHFYFEEFLHHLKKFNLSFVSFSSGIFIAYIFLSLFPRISKGVMEVGDGIFFIILWGFVIFHIGEKYVFQHVIGKMKKRRRLNDIRTVGFFINHIILGMSLTFFFAFDQPLVAYFALIPIFFHMLSSTIAVEHLHRHVRETTGGKILSSGSLFFGTLIGIMLDIQMKTFYALFAFIIGVLLYIVVRDTIPKYKEGSPIHFVVGIIVYLILLGIEGFVG